MDLKSKNGIPILFAALIVLVMASKDSPAEEDAAARQLSALSPLEQSLLQPVTASFTNTPLEKVAAALSQKMGVPILIDQKSLADVEVTLATPVSAVLRDVRFESALALVTEPLGLTWLLRNEVVMITTPSCEPTEETRFYPIAKLAHALGGTRNEERLRRLVLKQVRPTGWDEAGGASELRLFPNVLAASMPPQGHAELVQFLAELEHACGLQPRRPLDLRSQQVIEKALGVDAQIEFQQTPFGAALRQIADRYEVSIVADEQSLTEQGARLEMPITARLDHGKIGQSLHKLLSNLDLGWTIRHEAVWITSKTHLENALVRKFYCVDDLIGPGKPGALNGRELLDLIVGAVAPTSWGEVGGPAAIDLVPPKLLIVSQTPGVHQELGLQLARLRQALELGAAEAKESGDEEQRDEARCAVYQVNGLCAEDLATAIRETIAPESWITRDGTGSIHVIRADSRPPRSDDAEIPAPVETRGVLVIRQTAEIHREIAEFLQQLGATPRPPKNDREPGANSFQSPWSAKLWPASRTGSD